MKILVISNYNGTVTVRPEAEIFLGLKKRGHEVSIMTFGHSEYAQRFRDAGIQVIDYHPKKKFSWADVKIIREELVKGQYDILHAFNNKGMTNGIFAAQGLPVKLVFYRGYTGNIHWYDPFMYVKYLHPRVDGIMCLVEAVRQIFRKNLFFGKDKAVTINKGHRIEWYENTPTAGIREELSIPKDALLLVCAANSRPMKGVKYLLKATHYFDKSTPIHLMLAGNGMETPEFLKLIKQSPIRHQIHLLGFRNDVLEVVNASDVFVLASTKGEAITKAVIEAMSLGITPLITDIPGNHGLVINEQCGLVVPSKNPEALAKAMLHLNENRDLLAQYGPAAREHIRKRFNTDTTILEVEQFYQQLIEKKN